MFSDVTFDFTGRTALITGAASHSGIGRAIARGLGAAGARVAACDIDAEQLADLADEVPDALLGTVDVRSADQTRAFVERVAHHFGRIDILVNNAAVAPFRPIVDLDEATWDLTFDTNVKGYFLFAQAVARHMIAQGQGGSIVNISSISVHESGEHKVHYCASKAAVGSLTKGLALELARHGIRVNAVEPGDIDTQIVKDEYLARMLTDLANRGLPINRRGTGGDLVGAALFLCSEASAYMTGAAILVDGGDFAGSQLPDEVLRAYAAMKRSRG